MTIKKEITFLRENFIFYLASVLMILGLKCYYSQADSDSLLWILGPTAHWVELLSKIPFTYISGTGYVNHSLRMVIAPSCSGVRFMIITFAMLVFSFVHVVASQQEGVVSGNTNLVNPDASLSGSSVAKFGTLHAKARGWSWIAASVFLSWLFTVFVNGLRIIIAVYLPVYLECAGLMGGMLTQDRLHTMIGVVVYFAALLVIYRLAGWLVRSIAGADLCPGENGECFANSTVTCTNGRGKRFLLAFVRKCVPPAFWYFALTLGLPFLNRVYKGSMAGFTEFAILVMGCCALIMLPYIIVISLPGKK